MPVGAIVVVSFWGIWYIAGREYIFPAILEPYYPPWLNHVTHTIILPVNIVELFAVKHQYASDRKAITSLVAYTSSYSTFLVYIRLQTGRWVYPFLNKMDPLPVGVFITSTIIVGVVVYKVAKIIHDLFHGVKSSKNRLHSKGSRQKKE